jgi:hypothetical protein
LCALPATETYRTQKPFADAVKREIGSDSGRLALYATRDIIFYLDAPRPIAEYQAPDELQRGLHERSLRWLVLRRRDWRRLNLKGTVTLEESTHSWESTDSKENKLLLVEVGVKSRG